MLILPPPCLKQITDAAEAAFPEECCGLLAGRDDGGGGLAVTRVVPAANVTEGRAADSFEVDPQVRFDLMRALEGSDERLIGHYHSHPGGPAEPSATDLARAYEPELVWIITSVNDGRAAETRAYILDGDGKGFSELALAADNATKGT